MLFFPEYTLEMFLCNGILVQYFRKNNTYSYSSWLKLSMKVIIHIVNMNQVKETQKNNFFLTNIIINTLSSQQVNYIIFLFQVEHLAHKMAIFTHPSTVSVSDIHKKCLSHHLKPFKGHSSMLSPYSGSKKCPNDRVFKFTDQYINSNPNHMIYGLLETQDDALLYILFSDY